MDVARLRIGVVGLGDIAQKAYLPVLASLPGVELFLCTRDAEKVERIGDAHRIVFRTTDIEELLAAGLDGVFIHAATSAHVSLTERFLKAGVHVYVDKPLDYHYARAEYLVGLAEDMGRSLMVGFNRRYAPGYTDLLGQPRDLVIMQKNRTALPGPVRPVIFDDFIHVVDTLRFLLPGDIEVVDIRAKVEAGQLHHVLLQLSASGRTAIGIMNRDSGSTEEKLEVMGTGTKREVINLGDIIDHNGAQTLTRRPDWTPVSRQRGIEQACTHFLTAIRTQTLLPATDALQTHHLCETITTTITP